MGKLGIAETFKENWAKIPKGIRIAIVLGMSFVIAFGITLLIIGY